MLTYLIAILLLLTGTARAADTIPTPGLLCPSDGMSMTDVASFFRWTPISNCEDYEIQIARDAGFQDIYKDKRTKNVRYHEDCYFPKDILPVGAYWWRVRALVADREGPWSQVFRVTVNADHRPARQVVREIDPDRPVFLMRNREWDPRAVDPENVRRILPTNLAGVIVPDDISLWQGTGEAIAKARKYNDLGIDFVIWNNRARAPLSLLEYLFQNFEHCIGTAEGEHFWSYGWEKGPEGNVSEWDYVPRAWILCGKYGRIYFLGDGEPGNYKWTVVAHDHEDLLRRYRENIVPMFKSTIGMVALHSIGATQGLMASGWVRNCGFWADEFIWGECGFGKLGEIFPKGKPEASQCPWVYDLQMWLMGIASGSTVFHLESAHQWTDKAAASANYTRYFFPFVTAVVKHHLLPSRQAYLDSLRVAVACDYDQAKKNHDNRLEGQFGFLRDLYALKHTAFQEIVPDESRFGIICLLPPGTTCLNPKTKVVPQADLLDPGKARAIFESAYPRRFEGDAFQWECDGTVIVTNSNENLDVPQHYAMKLPTGPAHKISGAIGVHQFLIGKLEGKSFWFQINCEYPDRPLEMEIDCDTPPRVSVVPESACTASHWDPIGKRLTLKLSVKDGAAECTLSR